jgi:hypothetical protein
MYTMWTQIFENIQNGHIPKPVKDYIEYHGITVERVRQQMILVAELIDGLLSGKFEREAGVSYIEKAMKDCDWNNRVDWLAMSVFDMLSSRALLGYWFNAAADLFNDADVRAQTPEQLTNIVKRMCRQATETGEALSPEDVANLPDEEQQVQPQEDTIPYVLISVPVDDTPTAKSVIGAKKLVKAIRSAYNQHEQQHMYAVKGILGEIVRCNKSLHVAFDEDPLIKVPRQAKPQLIKNGWIGDE